MSGQLAFKTSGNKTIPASYSYINRAFRHSCINIMPLECHSCQSTGSMPGFRTISRIPKCLSESFNQYLSVFQFQSHIYLDGFNVFPEKFTPQIFEYFYYLPFLQLFDCLYRW